jgi:hypothetical protein
MKKYYLKKSLAHGTNRHSSGVVQLFWNHAFSLLCFFCLFFVFPFFWILKMLVFKQWQNSSNHSFKNVQIWKLFKFKNGTNQKKMFKSEICSYFKMLKFMNCSYYFYMTCREMVEKEVRGNGEKRGRCHNILEGARTPSLYIGWWTDTSIVKF